MDDIKLCITCKHYLISHNKYGYDKCTRLGHTTSLVNGEQIYNLLLDCEAERETGTKYADKCGIDGKHYVHIF